MILSNRFNAGVHRGHYQYDPALIPVLDYVVESIDLPHVDFPVFEVEVRERHRNPQTPALLRRLRDTLIPCGDGTWMAKRGLSASDAYSIDHARLSQQDLLDLYLLPDDHILDRHGFRAIEGPVFPDWRDGELAGVCVRNTSRDLEFVSEAKYTFSNFGWFLFGYDQYERGERVIVTEGVFDALALRHAGYNAVALGSCTPHPFQVACLMEKFSGFAVCFDDDLHGHVGAFAASRMLRAPVFLPGRKDAASCFEAGEAPSLREVSPGELRVLIANGADRYNSAAVAGVRQQRPLPYNG